MPSNVFNIPVYGKPIELTDSSVYVAINRKTGDINNVFELRYEDDDWFLYQLKNTGKDGEMGWVILADQGDYALKSVDTETIKYYFDKAEYVEPKGAWRLLRNSRYGFGKFTPIKPEDQTRFAMILFSGDEMLVPILIEKVAGEIES